MSITTTILCCMARCRRVASLLLLLHLMVGCGGAGGTEEARTETRRPVVVATTSIIGDVVANVGGDGIELIVLVGPGQDVHSYEPGPGALARVADAEVIFTNGFELEEQLGQTLAALAADEGIPLVPLSENLDWIGQESGVPDPHLWMDVANVIEWTRRVQQSLSGLEPTQADLFERRGEAYRVTLAALDREIAEASAAIPAEKRRLVTNHDAFSYFARAYGYTIVGTVMPGVSTSAEPSAGDLAALVAAARDAGVGALFVDHESSDTLARVVAEEGGLALIPLYSGSIGPPGSGAESYVGMMRTNLEAIVAALGS